MNNKAVAIVKAAGLMLSIAGMVVTSIAGSASTKNTLQDMVNKAVNK